MTSTQVLPQQIPQQIPMDNLLDQNNTSVAHNASLSTIAKHSSSAEPTIKVDFTWKKWKALISEEGDPEAKLQYILDYKTFSPHLVLKDAAEKATIGTGTLHPISIHADCVVKGQAIKLTAMKRLKTQYQHLSYAYSDTAEPVPMSWVSESGWKSWDFICLDEQQNPVAKFSANCWSLTHIGRIQFLGPKANDTAAREEIMVTGLTLFYCMVLRASSILSFVGAIFAKTGPVDSKKNK